jgi:hypothetical protein
LKFGGSMIAAIRRAVPAPGVTSPTRYTASSAVLRHPRRSCEREEGFEREKGMVWRGSKGVCATEGMTSLADR